MEINKNDTAIVFTDLQNDFLAKGGAVYDLVSESLDENHTIRNIENLLRVAKANDFKVFVSPHYYYSWDKTWEFGGKVEQMMHDVKMFDRKDPLSGEGVEGSGADWYASYKKYIQDGKTIIASPHKVYGPQQNDLALQLHKHGISKVVLAGMSANLCVESHLRDLIEEGFEVVVIKDATAAAIHPQLGNGYEAALTNFKFIASDVLSTEQVIESMEGARSDWESPGMSA